MNSISVRTLGRYRLLEQIGQGGMATVYKAFDPTEDKKYAVKVLPPFLAQQAQFRKRFEREAEVVMRLKHPNIVPLVDFGQENGYAYLVMPLLEAGSLANRMQEGALSPVEGGTVLEQLSSALDFAHQQGVIHRDVKPSNVLMDNQGNALLCDFGLARIHDASVSLTGSALLGTPAYISPEQAQGKKAGPASDQYSLGVILYQLCTGNVPFEAETPMAVVLKHISEPLPLARAQSPNVPEAIERVILKATAKLPAERFASLGEMNLVFQAALAHAQDPFSIPAPTIELPPSAIAIPTELEQKPKKRNRLARLAAAAALLLLLLLACPVSASVIRDLRGGPAEGSALLPVDMSGPQLTALAGTIESLSTQLAASGDGTQSPGQIHTAVMETLIAEDDGLFAVSSGTPGTPTGGTGTPATPGPSATPSKSPTPGPSPTASKTPTKTNTPAPGPSPTRSPTPTPSSTTTATVTAAATMLPPPTPTPDICAGLNLGSLALAGQEIKVDVINDSSQLVKIVGLFLDWPAANEELKKIELGGSKIWDDGDDTPPSDISSKWKGNRNLASGSTKTLTFFFDQDAQPYPYWLELTFDNGCTVTGGG